MHKKESGFTLIELTIVVAILGILIAIAVPNFMRIRDDANKNACIANMAQLRAAAIQWAVATKAKDTDRVTSLDALQPYLSTTVGNIKCPAGTAPYTVFVVKEGPACPNLGDNPLHVLP